MKELNVLISDTHFYDSSDDYISDYDHDHDDYF